MALKKDKIMLGNGFPVLPDFDAMETGEATKQDVYDTQGIIAYVQKTLKADQAYTSGDSFIYSGKLYKTTANIAKDANIVLTGAGANAEVSDDIIKQIRSQSHDPLEEKILICESEFEKTDISSTEYTASDSLTLEEMSALLDTSTLYVEAYYKNANGYNMVGSQFVSLDYMKEDNTDFIQVRGNVIYMGTVGGFNWYLNYNDNASSIALQLDSNFYATMTSSTAIKIRAYKIS